MKVKRIGDKRSVQWSLPTASVWHGLVKRSFRFYFSQELSVDWSVLRILISLIV